MFYKFEEYLQISQIRYLLIWGKSREFFFVGRLIGAFPFNSGIFLFVLLKMSTGNHLFNNLNCSLIDQKWSKILYLKRQYICLKIHETNTSYNTLPHNITRLTFCQNLGFWVISWYFFQDQAININSFFPLTKQQIIWQDTSVFEKTILLPSYYII